MMKHSIGPAPLPGPISKCIVATTVLLLGLALVAEGQAPDSASAGTSYPPMSSYPSGATATKPTSISEAVLIAVNSTGLEPQYRKCYAPPTHLIPEAQLSFDIQPDRVVVTSTLTVTPNPEWSSWLVQTALLQEGCSNNPWSYLSGAAQEAAAAAAAANITAEAQQPPPLVLNGLQLTRIGDVLLDGLPLPPSAYTVSEYNLVLLRPPNRTFEFKITNGLTMRNETGHEGLGLSPSGAYVTHCESQGFRRITYFIDRPDVLSKFTVRIQGDAEKFPVMLSNGNLKQAGQLPAGQHFAEFEDVIPKPCYLFALVAGQLAATEASHLSSISGIIIKLRVYTPGPQYLSQVQYALNSLREAMVWQEALLGREFYNDVYNMVGAEVFGPVGMENTGLVIIKLSSLAVSPDTHTDTEAQAVLNLMAHEYFHQWTGNRVTIRDWFNLVVKEGLTQFQEQLFAADVDAAATAAATPQLLQLTSHEEADTSNPVSQANCQSNSSGGLSSAGFSSRVLQLLQSNNPVSEAAAATGSSWQRVWQHQTSKAGGSLTGAVRVDSYTNPKSLYTWSVYDKGAEVFRMYHTLLGPEGFAHGMAKYTSDFDQQAAVFEDFHASLSAANPGVNLTGLLPWLSNETPPTLMVSRAYNSSSGSLMLTVQMRGWTGSEAAPLVPLKVGILDTSGRDIRFLLNAGADSNSSSSSSYPHLMQSGATAISAANAAEPGDLHASSSSSSSTDNHSDAQQLSSPGYSLVLLVSQSSQSFQLKLWPGMGLGAVSWLRDWSAPVSLGATSPESAAWVDDLIFVAKYDNNAYARWDAVQRLATRLMLSLYYAAGSAGQADHGTLASAVTDPSVSYQNAQQEMQAAHSVQLASDSGQADNSSGSRVDAAVNNGTGTVCLSSDTSEGCKLLNALVDALRTALTDSKLNGQYQALLLQLPTVSQLQATIPSVEKPVQAYKVRTWVVRQLANQLKPQLEAAVLQADAQLQALICNPVTCMPGAAPVPRVEQGTAQGPEPDVVLGGRRRLRSVNTHAGRKQRSLLDVNAQASSAEGSAVDVFSPPVISARSLRNAAQAMLAALNDNSLTLQVERRYTNLKALTDRLAAIRALEGTGAYSRTLADFYRRYGYLAPALNQWFEVQALSEQPNNSVNIARLMDDPAFNFSNPEQCNALLYSFAESVVNFHAEDGSGYQFMADAIVKVDPNNPTCATRLVQTLGGWSQLASQHRLLMCGQLARLSGALLSSSTAAAVQSAAAGCK